MHQDARDVLVSEFLCDVMYTLFFGGIRFTYNKTLSTTRSILRQARLLKFQTKSNTVSATFRRLQRAREHNVSSSIYSSATTLPSIARSATRQCMTFRTSYRSPQLSQKASWLAKYGFSKTRAGHIITHVVSSPSSTLHTNARCPFSSLRSLNLSLTTVECGCATNRTVSRSTPITS